MEFRRVDRGRAMCAAEIEINRQLAPEIYLGTAPIRRGGGGKLGPGGRGGAAPAATGRRARECSPGRPPCGGGGEARLARGAAGETAADAVDWLVVMHRFDEDG